MRSDWKVSVRRACSTLRVDRALYVYKSKRGDQAALKHRIKDICATRVRYGYPKSIRVDQGSEFISRDLDIWAYQRGVVLDFSRPGKPTDNSFIESFNGKFRTECLNTHWFLSLDDARQKMEDWRRDYNEVRPHSAIGNKAPISLLNGSSAPPPA
ncbi:putative transposase [Bradyrhizobium sp. USDA 3650]